ncbi:exodeoxyribonuclease VII small subunit [Moritella sp. 36]|uniref:exodeoxyribonuclease VII small subunit n=1 Tax=Moritella sp. 36 TaxID=2746233 RepID=UPI001BA71ECA|nr:exodeoxyribonuclease VII small subunit [Moritella sp. 36]QUM87933.1 exodeoxyribonuclease VII small subunit [Moritella sp. 36]
MAVKKPENMTFEASITELEAIVNSLEQGDCELDNALKQFERGISLTRASSQKLQHAEQQVAILLADGDQQTLSPFNSDSSN